MNCAFGRKHIISIHFQSYGTYAELNMFLI